MRYKVQLEFLEDFVFNKKDNGIDAVCVLFITLSLAKCNVKITLDQYLYWKYGPIYQLRYQQIQYSQLKIFFSYLE